MNFACLCTFCNSREMAGILSSVKICNDRQANELVQVIILSHLSSHPLTMQSIQLIARSIAAEVDAMGLKFEWYGGHEDEISRHHITKWLMNREFFLIESDQVNAFCLPGGKVVVFTGLLKALYAVRFFPLQTLQT